MYCYVLKLKEYPHYGIGKVVLFKTREHKKKKKKDKHYWQKDWYHWQKLYDLKDIRKYKHKIIKFLSNEQFSQKILREIDCNKYDMCIKNGYYIFYKRGSKEHINHKRHETYKNMCFKEGFSPIKSFT